MDVLNDVGMSWEEWCAAVQREPKDDDEFVEWVLAWVECVDPTEWR